MKRLRKWSLASALALAAAALSPTAASAGDSSTDGPSPSHATPTAAPSHAVSTGPTGGRSTSEPSGGPPTGGTGGSESPDASTLTVLATTDIHGHVYNWDYFRDAPYPQGRVKELGMARVKTIVDDVRASKPKASVMLVDNGDAIQGTPLTYLSAKQKHLLGSAGNPMATAFNDIGYDVLALGNHEFNYGLEFLNEYAGQLEAPLLGANVVRAGSDAPAFTPYVIQERVVGGKTVKVGVLGLVTPGVRVWDRAVVEGKLDFRDLVLTARDYVPRMKREGADVVVALVHSGLDAEGVAWDAGRLQENVAGSVASKVDDIDLVIGGHSHVDIPSKVFRAPDGDPVLFSQPSHWAQSVSEVSLPIDDDVDGTGYRVAWPKDDAAVGSLASARYAEAVVDSPSFLANPKLSADHAATVRYVNTVVAQSFEELSAATSHYADTPILDFVGEVMSDTVRTGLKGTEYEGLPVVAQTSPFSRTAVFPKGDVTIKDIAGLYIYDNTLGGVLVDGGQLKDYLEHSARYFVQVPEGGSFDPAKGTNALYPGATRGIPDYNFDALTGVNYEIDVTKPVGQRIVNLRHPDGRAIVRSDRFVLAVNNYRQNGGGDYPGMGRVPVVYDQQQEIRQLLIEHAQARKTIDKADFFVLNWSVVTSSQSAPSADPTSSLAPTDPGQPGGTGDRSNAPDRSGADSGDLVVETAANRPKTFGRLPKSGADVLGAAAASVAMIAFGAALLARRRFARE